MSTLEVMHFNLSAKACIQRLKDAGVGKTCAPLVAGTFSKCGVNDPAPSSPRPPAPFGSNGNQMRELTEQARDLIDKGQDLAGDGYSPEVADNLNELQRLVK